MSSSPLFKRAFVRGLNAQLIREGAAVYPSKEAADASADYIADQSNMPDPYFDGGAVNLKIASFLCENLIKAAELQCERAGNRYDSSVTKTAQSTSPEDIAGSDVWELMEKAAAETGSLMEGGDNTNDLPAAAKHNDEAALENMQRPENYANLGEDGVGNYERKGEGSIGSEQKHPKAPKASDGGGNSATANSKAASFADIVKRVARKTAGDTGSLITGGNATNDLPAAAMHNAEAALELKNRPQGYASMGEDGVGNTAMGVPSGAVVGREMTHPLAPAATDSGDNSIIDQTKNAFDQLFVNTAEQVVPYLPERMDDTQKVAHVRAMMGLETPERAEYLGNLYASLGAEKSAAYSVRDHFRKTAEAAESDKHEKAEENCDDDNDADDKKPGLPGFMMKEKQETKEQKQAAAGGSLSALRSRLQNLNS